MRRQATTEVKEVQKLNWYSFRDLKNILKNKIDEYSFNPYIRDYAESLTNGTGHNKKAKIFRIANHLDSIFTFNRDPVGREYLQSPVRLIKKIKFLGRFSGDCDDTTVLLNSLYNSIGLNTEMIFLSPKIKPKFTHVLTGVYDDAGVRYCIDLVNPYKFYPAHGEIKVVKT